MNEEDKKRLENIEIMALSLAALLELQNEDNMLGEQLNVLGAEYYGALRSLGGDPMSTLEDTGKPFKSAINKKELH